MERFESTFWYFTQPIDNRDGTGTGYRRNQGWAQPTREEIPGAAATASPVPSLVNSEKI